MKTKPQQYWLLPRKSGVAAHTLFLATALTAISLVPLQVMAALDIQFDYRYDATDFFSDANNDRRAVLEAAALYFEDRINDRFGAIVPSGENTWSLHFEDPSSGNLVEITNPILPADTIVVYVGARDLPGIRLGFAYYGYSWSGYPEWANLFAERNNTNNFDSFGGSISFDSATSWYFDPDVSTMEPFAGQQDFYTTALHELGHLLGFGSDAFAANRMMDQFVGSHVVSTYGQPAPLDPNSDHFREGLSFEGQETAMDPTQMSNSRKLFTELDWAVLQDIGYDIKEPVPSAITITSIRQTNNQVTLAWRGGQGPFQAQVRNPNGSWSDVGTSAMSNTVTFVVSGQMGIFRIAGH